MPTQSKRLAYVLIWLICVVAGEFVQGAERAEFVARSKNATALVDLGGFGSGTAFCIDARGFFLTNYHVVAHKGLGNTVRLILHPAQDNERELDARVISLSEEFDLAVLQTIGEANLTALSLVSAGKATETDAVTAYGYPFGKRLSAKGRGFPSISVNTGRISALRKRDRELQAIQIDAAVNPGNSGGPLVNEAGDVIGIMVAANPVARIAYAIPSDVASEFLRRPAVLVMLPELPYPRRHDILPFMIDTIEITKGSAADAVELEITNDRDSPRKFEAAFVNGKALIEAQIMETETKPLELRLTSRQSERSIDIPDRTVRFGSQECLLSEIRQIERRGEFQVITLTSGRRVAGRLQGLEDVRWTDGVNLVLHDEALLDVHGIEIGPLEVHLEFTALRKGEAVATWKQLVVLSGAPQPVSDEPFDPTDPFAPAVEEFEIEARIDGTDELVVTPTGLFWRHKTWSKPGEPTEKESYVLVNERRWPLKWRISTQQDPAADESELFPLKFDFELWEVELLSIKASPDAESDLTRGKVTSRQEPCSYVVVFDDQVNGSAIYRCRLKKKYQREAPKLTTEVAPKG